MTGHNLELLQNVSPATSISAQPLQGAQNGGKELNETFGGEGDSNLLETLRNKYVNNPSIGYLNINSLRGSKFPQLIELISKVNLIYFALMKPN